MLIEFYGKNFGGFRDAFQLSLLASDVDPQSERGIVEVKVEGEEEPLRLLRAAAIYGPNGSGKSTLLRAARSLRALIGDSGRFRSDSAIPSYEPFALDAKHQGQPVLLGVKAVIEGRVYDYRVEFVREAFTGERLAWWENGEEETVLFDRRGQKVRGTWTKRERFDLLSGDFRPNALLLSLADQLVPSLARNIAVGIRRLLSPFAFSPFDEWLAEGEFFSGATAAQRAHEDQAFRDWLLKQLRAADVGVVGLEVEKREPRAARPGKEGPSEGEDASYRLSLAHRGKSGATALPYGSESHGTKRLIEFAPMLFDLLRNPRPQAIFVDEIEESLHPLLLRGILGHLNCEVPLKDVRGQLIFATHDTTLIDGEARDAVLRRDQVYLTEKDNAGAARLYSVAEFKERNNLNLRHRYLQGRYGALPMLRVFGE